MKIYVCPYWSCFLQYFFLFVTFQYWWVKVCEVAGSACFAGFHKFLWGIKREGWCFHLPDGTVDHAELNSVLVSQIANLTAKFVLSCDLTIRPGTVSLYRGNVSSLPDNQCFSVASKWRVAAPLLTNGICRLQYYYGTRLPPTHTRPLSTLIWKLHILSLSPSTTLSTPPTPREQPGEAAASVSSPPYSPPSSCPVGSRLPRWRPLTSCLLF